MNDGADMRERELDKYLECVKCGANWENTVLGGTADGLFLTGGHGVRGGRGGGTEVGAASWGRITGPCCHTQVWASTGRWKRAEGADCLRGGSLVSASVVGQNTIN